MITHFQRKYNKWFTFPLSDEKLLREITEVERLPLIRRQPN